MADKDLREGYGQWLTDALEQSGYNLARLAAKTGISRQQLSRIKNGRSRPSWKTLRKLAQAMGVRAPRLETALLPPPKEPTGKVRQPSIEETGWLYGELDAAEERFRDFISAIERTVRGMVDASAPAGENLRRLRLAAIAAVREQCAAAGRPVPTFVQEVENEVIQGTFR